ncbi:DUF1837 domain-containing protein [Marinobacter halodurans]|uniref:DUF1837 domain-containing protein n=1 Tax=Marinobacter halodurans TaxID=2528979 RepID=A0ABY1ZGS2_9GAMM|nr:Hachiman antiphage defense system protein HamA [Marinobacter halodurans]TBW47843.1 DUF1837 domain-containing protein [Marinobacter halodurans]
MNGIITSTNSDSGGVGAKKGFLFQDHIAVRHILSLLSDSSVQEVHCETRDDISIVVSGTTGNYVLNIQVKTTDGAKKWSTEELCDSEIYIKQLKLDSLQVPAKFRIISSRDVGSSSVKTLLYPKEQRDAKKRQQLINVITRRHKGAVSPNKNSAEYWVDNCHWEVIKEIDAIKFRNQNSINSIAENFGYNLTSAQILEINDKLLLSAIEAAAASNKTEFEKKIFKKDEFEKRFKKLMDNAATSANPTKHPYSPEKIIKPFLIDVFYDTDAKIRTGHGLDIGLNLNEWRVDDFVEHLLIWLPEFCLQASELSNLPTNHLEYGKKLHDTTKRIRDKFSEQMDEILGNLTLHTCLRTALKSEPIPCKVFYLADTSQYKSFRNSHFVNNSGIQELWLGSSIISKVRFTETIPKCFDLIKSILDPKFVEKERRVIVDLFEASHYSSSDIVDFLDEDTSLNDLLSRLCISLLVIYRSDAFLDKENYKESIEEEMQKNFSKLLENLPSEIDSLKIYIFMIPAEDIDRLNDEFNKRLGG